MKWWFACTLQNKKENTTKRSHTDLDTDFASVGDASLEVFGFTISP